MKTKRIIKKLSLLFISLLITGIFQVLPVLAGASDIVIDGSSFEKELDGSLWNNPDHDIEIQNGKLIFSKESTESTALISKVNAKISKQHNELINAQVGMKFTQLPVGEKFILALGLASVESNSQEPGNVEIEFTNDNGLKVGIVAYDDDSEAVTIMEPMSCASVGSNLNIKAVISTSGIISLTVNS